jgi:hypothetical protein
MLKYFLTLVLLSFSLFLINCSDDSSSSTSTSTNHTPAVPSNPSPPDGATNVDYHVTLSWQCSDPDPGDTLVYDIYFSQQNPPTMYKGNHTSTVLDVGIVPANSVFYWKVVAKDKNNGMSTGPVWHFQVKP